MWRLAIFPPNGLDRGLHAPILIGLYLVTFFTEAFGWTYAGLVVPGYLAAVGIAAPLTCGLITVEAVVTYLAVASIGAWIPKTRAWSTMFGRERFFLFIVVAVLVRVGVEGYVVPELVGRWSFGHSRELYSVGLVLVPLYANVFWNSGVRAAFPRLIVVSALTYLVVELVLVRHTNFSLSRLLVANESGASEFLASPKAQMILVLGALLGARGNVMYGWDYNGILVPGLLAVAWYQPTKLAVTLVEALVIFGLSLGVTKLPPLSKVLIVGTRRMLVAFTVGLAAKMALGFAAARWAPRVNMADFVGYGYLLPSLLAVKMWNKAKIGVVLLPTLQVSLSAFLLGNVIGFGVAWAGSLAGAKPAPATLEESDSAASTLLFADTAPDPRRGYTGWATRDVTGALLRIVADIRATGGVSRQAEEHAEACGMRAVREAFGGWIAVVPRVADAREAVAAPRVALRAASAARSPWIVVAKPPAAGSSIVPVAFRVAEAVDAAALVLLSRHAELERSDVVSVEALVRAFGTEHLLIVEEGSGATTLSIAGTTPPRLGAEALSRVLGHAVSIEWRAPGVLGGSWPDAPRLRLPVGVSDAIGASALGAPEPEDWQGFSSRELRVRMKVLTSVGHEGFRPPSVEQLRLFSTLVEHLVVDGPGADGPTAWNRAVAGRLGYRFASPQDRGTWVLFEPDGSERGGHPTLVLRGGARAGGILVESPAPRWEVGTFAGALGLAHAIDARAVLVAGAMPHEGPGGLSDVRRTTGRRSLYQVVHERWLDAGGHAVSIQGIAPEHADVDDVVLSVGREIADPSREPPWTREVRGAFELLGQKVASFDGTRAHAAYGGGGDPTMAYAERFARDAYAIAWLAPGPRARLATLEVAERLAATLGRAHAIPEGDAAERVVSIVRSARTERCEFDEATLEWQRFAREGNPADLEGAGTGHGCFVTHVSDGPTGLVWAILAKRGEARLLPVGVPAMRSSRPLYDVESIRRAMWMHLAVIEVRSPPE